MGTTDLEFENFDFYIFVGSQNLASWAGPGPGLGPACAMTGPGLGTPGPGLVPPCPFLGQGLGPGPGLGPGNLVRLAMLSTGLLLARCSAH